MERIGSQIEWGSDFNNSFASMGLSHFYKMGMLIAITNIYKDKNELIHVLEI